MARSVPSVDEVQGRYVATLVDEWIRRGLRDVVVCPGSRSTPLALAVCARDELRVHVRLDERSAGFYALGRALVTDRPVAVVVTSGTAAAELHASVAEAHHARVPLVVVTADRPERLHGVGAPQTMDQRALFGPFVSHFEDPGVAEWEQRDTWRRLAGRVYESSLAPRRGPVHLNAAFEEPLVVRSLVAEAADEAGSIPEPASSKVLPDEVVGAARVLCVVGAGVAPDVVEGLRRVGWVVIGDATTNSTTPYADVLLRDGDLVERLRPDVVVRLGGLVASKVVLQVLGEWRVPVVAVDPTGSVADPDRIVTRHYEGLVDLDRLEVTPHQYADDWRAASRAVGAYLDGTLDGDFDEIAVARTVVDVANETRSALVVGSSMPVRDVEWWSDARVVPTFSNRGVNGIDGVVSTFLGVAASGPAIGLVGDLTMLHDVSALVDGPADGSTAVLVVVDNRGGGIFSFLPQANALDAQTFERLFGTPHRHDLARVVEGFGYEVRVVESRGDLRDTLKAWTATSGLRVVVARVPSRDENVKRHRAHVEEATAKAREALSC